MYVGLHDCLCCLACCTRRMFVTVEIAMSVLELTRPKQRLKISMRVRWLFNFSTTLPSFLVFYTHWRVLNMSGLLEDGGTYDRRSC